MDNNEIELKLVDMEIKMAYQESTILELNSVVSSQMKEIGIMENHIQKLEKKIESILDSGAGDELPSRRPPHY